MNTTNQNIKKTNYVELFVPSNIEFFTSSVVFSFVAAPNLETEFSAILPQEIASRIEQSLFFFSRVLRAAERHPAEIPARGVL